MVFLYLLSRFYHFYFYSIVGHFIPLKVFAVAHPTITSHPVQNINELSVNEYILIR